MSFDKLTNTISLGEDSDFMVDSGLFFYHQLKKNASQKDASTKCLNDWEVIDGWLHADGKKTSENDDVRVGKAWKSFLAMGLAPSFELQEAFDSYAKKYKAEGYSFKEDKPPAEIFAIFNLMIATEKQFEEKRKYDWEQERKKFEILFKKIGTKPTLNQRVSKLSKNTRIFIIGSLAWFMWAVFRSSNDYVVLGVYFEYWEEDMFFVNALLPIALVWVGFKAFKWITNAT